MPDADTVFARLADGTTLLRRDDGSFHAVPSATDVARVRAMTDAEIERHAASDPDHPALDDAFWAGVDAREASPLPSDAVRLDADVLSFFRRDGDGHEARINAVLRRHVETEAAR